MTGSNGFIARAVGLSDPGLVRSNNEDSFLIREDLGLFVVADGMGGTAAGEVASRLFVKTAEEVFLSGLKRRRDFEGLVLEAFENAHRRIREEAERFPEYLGMGCTAEILALGAGGYHLGHVGDSRTYLKDSRGFRLLTRDHTYVRDQVDLGVLTEEEARKHRLRHVLSRAVGYDDNILVDQSSDSLEPGETFLLCSDGLTDEVSEESMERILSQDKDLEAMARDLVDAAKQSGGRDNITVVLVHVPMDEEQAAARGFKDLFSWVWNK